MPSRKCIRIRASIYISLLLYCCKVITTKSMTLTPHQSIRGVFVGSGSDGLGDPRIADAIIKLTASSKTTDKITASPKILYIGTATYDLPMFRMQQLQCFVDRGCTITSLEVALKEDDMAIKKIDEADVIVVAGGNTLFAMDRWTKLGLIPHLRRAMERGAVLSGGSAGAICWFDGGHSDSMDPDSYKVAMLEKYGSKNEIEKAVDESSELGEHIKDWKYIRVPGLGFLSGLICPHHDRVQSNGVLRAHDFDQMLLKHQGERGIGIDHWAALIVSGESYKVLSLEGKVGSVIIDRTEDESCADFRAGEGVPGIWIKDVMEDGRIHTRLCPQEGKLSDLLQPAKNIIQDAEVERCRLANPSL